MNVVHSLAIFIMRTSRVHPTESLYVLHDLARFWGQEDPSHLPSVGSGFTELMVGAFSQGLPAIMSSPTLAAGLMLVSGPVPTFPLGAQEDMVSICTFSQESPLPPSCTCCTLSARSCPNPTCSRGSCHMGPWASKTAVCSLLSVAQAPASLFLFSLPWFCFLG